MNQSKNSGGYIFTVNMNSMQIILPISMLSFLFSQSPICDGLLDFLQIYGFDSTSTISIRAKRAYAFLLFNGLLALLINNSGASKRVPESIRSLKTAIQTTVCKYIEEDEEEEDDHTVADRFTEQVLTGDHEECEETEEYDRCDDILADDEGDDDIVADRDTEQVLARDHDEFEETEEDHRGDDANDDVLADDDEDENDKCDDLILSDESDEEETEEVVAWGISVEELNSKCDDFIKNMKHLL